MNKLRIGMSLGLIAITVLCWGLFNIYADQGANTQYIMDAGDVVEISVWNHAELKSVAPIRPDGLISYPVAGEVQASGLTTAQLSEKIREKLMTYMKDPQIAVNVIEYRSKKLLVLGEVKNQGLYPCDTQMTAFEAVGLAGGALKYAELRSILVVRNPYTSNPQFFLVNLHRGLHHKNTKENVILQPKDIVYVPRSFIGNLGDFFNYFISIVKPAADSYYLYDIAKD